jgi:hypothetical protein
MEQQEKRRLQSLGLQPVTDIQFVARELQHTRQPRCWHLANMASELHSLSCQLPGKAGTGHQRRHCTHRLWVRRRQSRHWYPLEPRVKIDGQVRGPFGVSGCRCGMLRSTILGTTHLP